MDNMFVPAGKIIYLKKKNNDTLCIRPGKILLNDNLYVAYDVKINGIVVIPKNSRVQGDWITEHTPSIAAQFQMSKIYMPHTYSSKISTTGKEISGESRVIEYTDIYNNDDVRNADYFFLKKSIITSGNVTHRIIELGCKIKTLPDNMLDSVYLEINTKEIPVILSKDFTY